MGIVRKFRQLKAAGQAANEAAAASGAPPEMQRGLVAGFANVMAQAMAPHTAAMAERRGGSLAGSDPHMADRSFWPASPDAGAEAIKARDPAFDTALLAAFGEQVFAAVAAVWAGADSGDVRPVMSDQLWEPLAAATGIGRRGGGSLHPFAWLGQQQVAAEVIGLHAGTWYDSAMILMHVHVIGPLPQGMPPQWTAWDEDWLFQRSAHPGGNPATRPAACPSCGAPTRAGDGGHCLHCQAPIPFLTTGWLACGIVSHHPSHVIRRERFAQSIAANPAAFANIPPAMRQFLPDTDGPPAGESSLKPASGFGPGSQQ